MMHSKHRQRFVLWVSDCLAAAVAAGMISEAAAAAAIIAAETAHPARVADATLRVDDIAAKGAIMAAILA